MEPENPFDIADKLPTAPKVDPLAKWVPNLVPGENGEMLPGDEETARRLAESGYAGGYKRVRGEVPDGFHKAGQKIEGADPDVVVKKRQKIDGFAG